MQTSTHTQSSQPVMPPDIEQRAGKHPIFHSGIDEYGTEVAGIREIVDLQDLATVPNVRTQASE